MKRPSARARRPGAPPAEAPSPPSDTCSHGVHGPWCREWERMRVRAERADHDQAARLLAERRQEELEQERNAAIDHLIEVRRVLKAKGGENTVEVAKRLMSLVDTLNIRPA